MRERERARIDLARLIVERIPNSASRRPAIIIERPSFLEDSLDITVDVFFSATTPSGVNTIWKKKLETAGFLRHTRQEMDEVKKVATIYDLKERAPSFTLIPTPAY